jgi:3-deoxy-D-manno-octulosonate cytidylyltransferase
MKSAVIIPARMAATRFPGKPLARILGKPMIAWVVEAALSAELVDRVIVATDDERIKAVAEASGAAVFIDDKPYASGTERCAAAARGEDADLVINAQGDEPLIEPSDLDMLIRFMAGPESEGYDVASLFYRGRPEQAEDENIVKLVIDPDDHRDRLGLRHPAVWFTRQPVDPVAKTLIHVGVYAFRKPFLSQAAKMKPTIHEKAERLEQLRWLGHGARMMMFMAKAPCQAVDTPEDIERVEAILRARGI